MGNSDTPTAAPFDGLDAADLDAVHEASMYIVEELGIQFNHERAQAVVADHGGSVDADGVVTLPRDLLMEAVGRAPSTFTLHARDPAKSVTVGGDGAPVRAPSYGPATIHTYGGQTGATADGEAGGGAADERPGRDGADYSLGAANYERRDATLADYERLVKLAHAEDAMTCAGYSICRPTDVPRPERHVETLARTLTLTDKPVMGPTRGADRAQTCVEMVGLATGDPALSEPRVAGLVNTTPPRSVDGATLGGLLTYADHGQPLVVSSFTMAGASGPPTVAASLAQANAENLAVIALTQLVTPGTPVVYGVPSATIDDRYGSLSIGGPESALFVALAGQLARYYHLPSRGGGALSDAKAVDYQSGFESAFVGTVTAVSDLDFVLNAAGVLESYAAVSPEKFVLDCELLGSLDRVREGVTVDAETLSLDRIADADPASHFLDDGDGEVRPFHRPAVVDKRAHGDWAGDGRRSAFELGHERVQHLLDEYERPAMDPESERELAAFVADHTAD
ncbi:MAG: trimethylamine methyltransferase family protein [Haloarculaceae archaeon]